jgi:hypothetical protein
VLTPYGPVPQVSRECATIVPATNCPLPHLEICAILLSQALHSLLAGCVVFSKLIPVILFCIAGQIAAQDTQIPLAVNAGAPLRLYITKRLPMRAGEPVEAKLIAPVFAFDRIVIPAGAVVLGHVTTLDAISKGRRIQAIIGGDFTPIHFARVEFTELRMPDGRALPIHTYDSEGLPTLYSPPRPNKKGANKGGAQPAILIRAKEQAQQQIESRTQGVISMVRGPDKKERIEEFLVNKLPYRPQWYRRNTRFDAVLSQPLPFGAAQVPVESLRNIGLPGGDSLAEVRLLTPLNSRTAVLNGPVQAVIEQPVFSPDHRLLLPEGALITGRVRRVQRARWFHRGGQLRFTFDRVEPPGFLKTPAIPTDRSQIQLAVAETDPASHVKVDSEGNAKATAPKTRLLAPAIALVMANRAADNDAGRNGTTSATGNYGGRSLGGFSGFGYLGTAAAQSSKTVGAVLGYYGLAVSVFSAIVSRGSEVEFPKNAVVDVRFGTRVPAANQFLESAGN